MTEEDKQLIAGYMGWQNEYGRRMSFDLNDAAICVQEVQKRGDVGSFIQFSWGLKTIYSERRNSLLEYIPYIFNADNFFNAMSEWLEEKGK